MDRKKYSQLFFIFQKSFQVKVKVTREIVLIYFSSISQVIFQDNPVFMHCDC